MNNGKVVVKKYKMSGGVKDDYDWSNKELQSAFLENCKINETPNTHFDLERCAF